MINTFYTPFGLITFMPRGYGKPDCVCVCVPAVTARQLQCTKK